MSKILSIDDMLETAMETDLPDYAYHVSGMETAATRLAAALGKHLGIVAGYADWQGKAFAGLCAPFSPAFEGQKCPEVIVEGDPGGDWEFMEQPHEKT